MGRREQAVNNTCFLIPPQAYDNSVQMETTMMQQQINEEAVKELADFIDNIKNFASNDSQTKSWIQTL